MSRHPSLWSRAMRFWAVLALAASFAVAVPALAEAPSVLQIQGVMTTAGGAPVSDGKYALTFSLYNTQTGGVPLWSEVIPTVNVAAGRFETALGAVDPLKPFPGAKLASEAELWLAMRIFDDPDLPRVRLLSTPYAIEALHAKSAESAKSADSAKAANTASDLSCSGCVSVAEITFDAPVDLKGNTLASGAIASSSSVKAVSFEGDGSKLTGIKIPQGTCGDGKFATGIDTDGNLVCSTIPTAADVSCTGCITPDKVAFQYAGSDAKGGPALTSYDVTCTGCISVDELKFDKDVDLGAKNLATTGSVTAASFLGDGSKLSGIKIPAGNCKSGEVLTGLKADGSLVCSTFAITPASLPLDGIDEISNGRIQNQFVYTAAGKPNLPIPDYNLNGTTDTITVPSSWGIAQKLTVSISISKAYSGVEKNFTVTLVDPNNVVYTLHDPSASTTGNVLTTTYPDPTMPVKGDLTTWIGQNPGLGTNNGQWTIKAVDNEFNGKTPDGAILSWAINVQVVSNSQIQVNGDLITTGSTSVAGDSVITGALTVNGGITAKGAGGIDITGDLIIRAGNGDILFKVDSTKKQVIVSKGAGLFIQDAAGNSFMDIDPVTNKKPRSAFPEGSTPYLYGMVNDHTNGNLLWEEGWHWVNYASGFGTSNASLHKYMNEIIYGDANGNFFKGYGAVNYGNGQSDYTEQHTAAFIKNTTSGNITRSICYYFSTHPWAHGNYTSLALNGSDVWSASNNNAGQNCTNVTFPANQTSLLALKTGCYMWTPWNGYYDRSIIGFYNNTMAPTNGLLFDYDRYDQWLSNK